ncbi:prephenate dehydrogenase [Acidithiobacillus ferrivorans]|uniref:Prephenate dehydrogenase n=2 Tax=Acidithiobacillus ferrivorans TaxID=160808 RepID=A0A7T4WBJ7_9PROT|nr:prephenate dehydrogenase [Acidithiobacillus ferrivorans]MBN6739255.1 prephenate dehydrogenase [Acidithiobacillus sp. MC6.1]QQD71539.1 prephenate dehydrogenase [Acidithiobacillus ferrivorans]
MSGIPFQRVTIIGLGLMGGSVAKALRNRGFAGSLVGVLADAAAVQRMGSAVQQWRISLTHELESALRDADLVLLATPPQIILQQLPEWARHISSETLVSDVASIKAPIAQLGRQLLGDRFIAGHPVVGGEKTGFAAAQESLYQGTRVILTPLPGQALNAVNALGDFWQNLGATVSQMTPEAHDQALAATSHLPHLLAFAYMAGLDDQAPVLRDLAGGGLRDFTRIAASDPDLWAAILWENRAIVGQHLQALQKTLGNVEQILAGNDRSALRTLLERGRDCRQQFQFPPVHP